MARTTVPAFPKTQNPAYRDPDYIDWCRGRFLHCQVPGCTERANDPCHGRKAYPFGGGGGQKSSDYSILMECRAHHAVETAPGGGYHAVWKPGERDKIVIHNLQLYIVEETGR